MLGCRVFIRFERCTPQPTRESVGLESEGVVQLRDRMTANEVAKQLESALLL